MSEKEVVHFTVSCDERLMAENTKLTRALDAACKYVMELDACYYQCPWVAERWENSKRCFDDCRPKGDNVQEKSCWRKFFMETNG